MYLAKVIPLSDLQFFFRNFSPKRIELSEYPGFTRAAVLALLFPANRGLSTILTKRTDLVDTHKGQVAFPGGAVDKEDPDLISTALRETHEEIGVDTGQISVLGTLDEHPVPSQFLITPVVGFTQKQPSVTPHAVEVAEVFDVPLAFFADERNSWTEERLFRGEKRTVWFYSFEGRIIWGATASIIRNLVSVIGLNQ